MNNKSIVTYTIDDNKTFSDIIERGSEYLYEYDSIIYRPSDEQLEQVRASWKDEDCLI